MITPNTTYSLTIGRLLDYMYGKEPATAVAYDESGLVCRLIKDGVASVKTLASSDWTELVGGFYKLQLSASEVGNAGELIVALECEHNFLSWQIRLEVAEDKLDNLHARFLNKAVKNATTIQVYESDGTTVKFSQGWSANGVTESVEAAV